MAHSKTRNRKKVKSLGCVPLSVTPWTVAYQAPPSMEFSRQEYWSGLPFPSPGDLHYIWMLLRGYETVSFHTRKGIRSQIHKGSMGTCLLSPAMLPYSLSLENTWPTPTSAAAAKSLQSCPTLCDPIDGCPPGSPVPGILQARTLEWVAISWLLLNYY